MFSFWKDNRDVFQKLLADWKDNYAGFELDNRLLIENCPAAGNELERMTKGLNVGGSDISGLFSIVAATPCANRTAGRIALQVLDNRRLMHAGAVRIVRAAGEEVLRTGQDMETGNKYASLYSAYCVARDVIRDLRKIISEHDSCVRPLEQRTGHRDRLLYSQESYKFLIASIYDIRDVAACIHRMQGFGSVQDKQVKIENNFSIGTLRKTYADMRRVEKNLKQHSLLLLSAPLRHMRLHNKNLDTLIQHLAAHLDAPMRAGLAPAPAPQSYRK